MSGSLFIVSTPIGNLEDITLRALRVLKEADAILCEDTRVTGKLLSNFQIENKKLVSFHEHNEERRILEAISRLKGAEKLALVSDSGTPLISDPGFKLVRECHREGIKVEAIPGASAILAALVSSGLPPDKFLFVGYLPKRESKRKKLLLSLRETQEKLSPTIILYESPHRLVKTLEDIKEELGDIEVVIARELTKVHEEITRDKLSRMIARFEKAKPRGEITLLIPAKLADI